MVTNLLKVKVAALLIHRLNVSNQHIQAIKSDSQRLAFLMLSLGFVFTVACFSFVVALLTPYCGVMCFLA
ncbi:hypothetical protein DXJ57_19340 [Vibrio fluvialis]|nr:hypothetical protein [Vibrio fluvialis]